MEWEPEDNAWLQYSKFEERCKETEKGRRVMERIFTDYADLEMRLGNIDRCRKIYEKFLEAHPQNPKAWNVYIDLEDSVGELDRARELCKIAVQLERLDMPELVWKRYIDLEVSNDEI